MSDGTDSGLVNRLAGEASSYLRSHATDPVAWQPWGEEAFSTARRLGRPVFLSAGYDSCHWCHVMQRESFRDEATATVLNERFVAVKVDRELLPDVDHIYMSYVNLATGHGGWPMSVFLTPEGVPFFGGTYYPPEPRYGMPSFLEVLAGVSDAFAADATAIAEVGEEALEMMRRAMRPSSAGAVEAGLVDGATTALLVQRDPVNGGIGRAPKFPQLPTVSFLFARAAVRGDEAAGEMADQWLRAMLRGGIYDHVGGGLFRYATDESWLVPHFEKMLYDNGLLLRALACSYRRHADEEIAAAARQTAAFMARDLAAEAGGYISSLDADTDGVEGATYVWSFDELASSLDAGDLALAQRHLGVDPSGNWEGRTIVTRRGGRDADAQEVDAVLSRLLEVRSGRSQPKRVETRLTEWNGYAAQGLIEAGEAIGVRELVDQGVEVARWLYSEASSDTGTVHAVGSEHVEAPGVLADYAACASAFLAAAPYDRALGDRAALLVDSAFERFSRGDVFAMSDRADLVVTPFAYEDAPTPSGAALLAACYARLRPDDMATLMSVLGPATGIVARAPAMAGEWLRVMLGVTAPT